MIDATTKAVLEGVAMYAMVGNDNTDTGAALASAVSTSDDGSGYNFALAVPSAQSYTILAARDGWMTNWQSGVAAADGDALVVLPPNQLGGDSTRRRRRLDASAADDGGDDDGDASDTATLVLMWGAQASAQATYDSYLGTPVDLDLYLQFEAVESTGEVCLVNYITPDCGDAAIVQTDALCCVESAITGGAGSVAVASRWGVETVQIKKFHTTSYSVWIANFGLEQPLQTADATITVFVRDARLTQVTLPQPCDATDAEGVAACEYYDAPLAFDATDVANGYYPFAYPEDNRALAQYARVLCLEMTNETAILNECQRYYDATAFGYLSAASLDCPAVFDDCLVSGVDDTYVCSNEIPNAIVTCAGGVSSSIFCDVGEICAYGPFDTADYDDDDARSMMCASNGATPAPTPVGTEIDCDGFVDDMCYDYGWWDLQHARQFVFNQSSLFNRNSPCELQGRILQDGANARWRRHYAWLDPGYLPCANNWTDVGLTVTMRGWNTVDGKGRMGIITRDNIGVGTCEENDPSVGYGFELNFGDQTAEIQRRRGCEQKKDLIAVPMVIDIETDYTLRAVSNGTRQSFWVNDVLTAEVEDDTFAMGSVGIYGFRMDFAISHVSVLNLNAANASSSGY